MVLLLYFLVKLVSPKILLTVFPRKSLTLQWRYTLLPNCVVTLAVELGSSKNGYGSCVVVSSGSSSMSFSGISVNVEKSRQKCVLLMPNCSLGLDLMTEMKEREKYHCGRLINRNTHYWDDIQLNRPVIDI